MTDRPESLTPGQLIGATASNVLGVLGLSSGGEHGTVALVSVGRLGVDLSWRGAVNGLLGRLRFRLCSGDLSIRSATRGSREHGVRQVRHGQGHQVDLRVELLA